MRPKSTWSSPLDAWCAGSNVSRPGLPLSLLSGLGHELLRAQRSAGSSHQAGRRWVGSGLGNRFEPVTHPPPLRCPRAVAARHRRPSPVSDDHRSIALTPLFFFLASSPQGQFPKATK
ncbi:hypothetical protein V6N11_056817 [Hibiscus sabdariffa]|uniref:Uncharacterized protein n=1 Tax=Hibiscus sabdariffa TaxID=183260 RepID=A0ABR2T5W9_9ROSI